MKTNIPEYIKNPYIYKAYLNEIVGFGKTVRRPDEVTICQGICKYCQSTVSMEVKDET